MKKLSEASMKVLCKQYFEPSDTAAECPLCGKKHETLNAFWDRVSFGKEEYRRYLEELDFLPNSPTLFNAGTSTKGTLSGCFKFDVGDTMDEIMNVAYKSAFVQKWGGGVGYTLSDLRPKGAPISSTHGHACGPVACLFLYQAVADLITQGGKRQGAQMAILHCDHPDVSEFIHCKDESQTLNTFNISVAITDDFMEKVTQDVDSKEYHIFTELVEHAWQCGDPGIYFIDEAERYNTTPHLGKLTGTNPCGEVPLLDNEPCNLASINLSNFVLLKSEGYYEEGFDFDRLSDVAEVATRYLDYVLDNNTFSVDEVTEAAHKTRKLGLGVMGWADALALLQIPYDSDEAVGLAETVMQVIQSSAHDTSKALGAVLGPYPGAVEGVVERNAAVTCIAPAGSISTIADCSSGIEPHYALEYTSIMGDGTQLKRTVPVLDRCGSFVPKTAHEIGWRWHVRHQAAFQKYTDLAVSKTVNLPHNAKVQDVWDVYMMAWREHCKGTTIYRDGSKNLQAFYKEGELPGAEKNNSGYGVRHKLPKDGVSLRHKFEVGEMEGYLHIGVFENQQPGELFITGVKEGSTVSGLLNGISILTSLALQYGVPIEAIVSKMQGTKFEPAGMTGNKDIPTATSVLDYIFRYVLLRTSGENLIETEYSGMLCPTCHAPAIYEEGCVVCSARCGWSRC